MREPAAVLGLDPYRIVAVIDGKKIITGWAQIFLQNAYAAATDERKTLPIRLQDEYLRFMVACRAHQLHLDLLPPWKDQLDGYLTSRAPDQIWYLALGADADADPTLFTRPLPPVFRTSHIVNRPPAVHGDPSFGDPEYAQPEQVNQVEKILWEAYIDRFPTQAEKQRELQTLKQKYKLIDYHRSRLF